MPFTQAMVRCAVEKTGASLLEDALEGSEVQLESIIIPMYALLETARVQTIHNIRVKAQIAELEKAIKR